MAETRGFCHNGACPENTPLLTFASQNLMRPVVIAARYGNRPDALLEILHDLQGDVGHVPESSLPLIAKALNLSRAEVYGVATFYHDFHLKPSGNHVIKLCRAEACQSMGARSCRPWSKNSST